MEDGNANRSCRACANQLKCPQYKAAQHTANKEEYLRYIQERCKQFSAAGMPKYTRLADTAFDDMVQELVGRVIVGVIPDSNGEMAVMMDPEVLLKDEPDPDGYIDMIIGQLERLKRSEPFNKARGYMLDAALDRPCGQQARMGEKAR